MDNLNEGYLLIKENNMQVKQSNKKEQEYTRDDIKNWIGFGINNGYVNKFKKEEINKWAELMLKHGVIKMNPSNRLANNIQSE